MSSRKEMKWTNVTVTGWHVPDVRYHIHIISFLVDFYLRRWCYHKLQGCQTDDCSSSWTKKMKPAISHRKSDHIRTMTHIIRQTVTSKTEQKQSVMTRQKHTKDSYSCHIRSWHSMGGSGSAGRAGVGLCVYIIDAQICTTALPAGCLCISLNNYIFSLFVQHEGLKTLISSCNPVLCNDE